MEPHRFERPPRAESRYCVKCAKPEGAIEHWPFECDGRPVREVDGYEIAPSRVILWIDEFLSGVHDADVVAVLRDIRASGSGWVFEGGRHAPAQDVRPRAGVHG